MIDFSNITAVALGVEDVLQIQDSLGTVLWQKAQPLANYFYVEDISGNGSTVSIQKGGSQAPTIQPYFSTDGTNWYSVGTTSSSTPLTYNVPANSKLYIKCTTNNWAYNTWDVNQNKTNRISVSDDFNVGGNIMSLLYGDNFENVTFTSNNANAFSFILYGQTHLLSAANLELPTNTVSYSYCGLFNSCTNLTTVPVLPATTVADVAYANMFQNCTSLTIPPALSATTVGIASYQSMFEGCTALTTPPVLPATIINQRQTYMYMFRGCTSLDKMYVYADTITGENATNNWLYNVAPTGDFYALGSANWTIDSPSGVPVGWTLHNTLPLPYNVSISGGNNGTISVNGVTGDYSDTVMGGTTLTLMATPDAGYYFTGWSDGDSNASRTITVTGDLTLTASFAQVVNYNVSVSAGSNGSVSVNGITGNYSQSVAAGTTLTLAATADSGYMFDTWSDGDTNATRTITVTGNITLTASFVVEQQRNNEIWYETSNGQTADFSNTGFNANLVSNTYSNGRGIAKFDTNLTSTTGNSSGTVSTATNLTKITFPDTFTSVGQYSFFKCPLTEINLNNVTTVGYRAFDFNQVTSLHIPASLTTINNMGLRGMYLTNITVDANNPTYNDGSSHNGSNCVYSGTTLILGAANTVIPDNCTTTGQWCMSSNKSLTTLDFPATLTSISSWTADFDTNVVSNPALSVVYARSNPSFGTDTFNHQKTNGTLYYTSNVNYQNWLNRLPSGWTAVLLCNTTISAGSNGSVSVNGVSGNYHQPELVSGTQLTLVATPAAGYQFDSWSDGDTNATRTVTITADTTLTASFVQQQPVGEPFYVEDVSGSSNTLTIMKNDANAPTIEVFKSTDGTNWTSMGNTSTSGITATVPANGKLYLKATTNSWRDSSGQYYDHNIDCSGNFKVGGYITSLLFGDSYTVYPLTSTNNYAFEDLFSGDTHLTDASDLVLPDSTAVSCYTGTFENCTALAGAPVLPATTLAMNCYVRMFSGCSSLNEIVTYADTLGSNSTYHWLAGVAATGDFYNLGSAIYSSDASGIPSGWTVHTSL